MSKRTLTIRGVPESVYLALRAQANREGRSYTDVFGETRVRGLLTPDNRGVYHDLDHLIGTWQEDPEFDKAIAEQDQVEPEMWL